MADEQIRVVVLEEPNTLHLVSQFLQMSEDVEVIGIAHNDKELRRLIARLNPEVIVVRTTLIRHFPALITHLAHAHRQTKCVIARQQEDATLLALYLQQGAVGYTLHEDGADCAVIVHRAKYRAIWIDPDVAKAINTTLHHLAESRRVQRILPKHEQLILDHIMLGQTCQMIATLNSAWSESVVLGLIYNLIYHFQNPSSQ